MKRGLPILVFFNFDARGSRGPSILFATSGGNGRLIAEFARAARKPVGSSLGRAGARLLGRGTDFHVLERAGIAGLDFAFIDGAASYHNLLDRPENLSLSSLQHHGELALGLAQRFGDLDLRGLEKEPEVTYFNAAGGVFIHYPRSWAWTLAAAALTMLAALLGAAMRRGTLSIKSLLPALGLAIGWALAAASWGMVAWLSEQLLGLCGFPTSDPPGGERFRSPMRASCLAVGSLAVTSPLVAWTVMRYGALTAAGAGLLFWSLLLVALHAVAPEGGYLATWPLLAALPGYAVLIGGAGEKRRRWWKGIVAALSAAAAVAFLAPSLSLFHAGVSLYPFPGMVATAFFAGCAITLIVPALAQLDTGGPRFLALLAAGATLVLMVVAYFS